MRIKLITLVILIAVTTISFGQKESINKLDNNGKKDGNWIVFLDQNWKEVKTENQADYFRYTYYIHGVNIYPMGPCGKKGWSLSSESKKNTKATKPILLDGEYTWTTNKGLLSSTHSFKNGNYVNCKEFFPDGKVSQHFDYKRKYKSEDYTYSIYHYKKDGSYKFYIMKDGANGWTYYPSNDEDLTSH